MVPDVLVGVAHDGDVGNPDDTPAVGLHNCGSYVLGGHRPVPDGHGPLAVTGPDRAGFTHQIEIGQPLVHLVRGHTHRRHEFAVQLDLDQPLAASVRGDHRDPLDAAQFGNHDVVEVFPKRFQRPRTREGVAQQRLPLGLPELVRNIGRDDDPVDPGGKLVLLQRREPLGEIETREVHVDVAREVDLDPRLALGRSRDDLFDAFHQLDCRFQRRGQKRLHRLRRGTPPRALDREPGQFRVGHQFDRDVLPRPHAEKGHRDVRHRDSHRPAHAQPDHGVPAFCTTRPSCRDPLPLRLLHPRRTSSITE